MARNLKTFYTGDKSTFFVWFNIKYTNDKGAASDLHSILDELGIKIKYGYLDNIEQSNHSKYALLTELENTESIEDVVNKLKVIPDIVDITYKISKNKMIHPLEFPLCFLGERSIIIRIKTLTYLMKIIHNNVIQPEGLMMMAGVRCGKDTAENIKTMVHVDKNNTFQILQELFLACGWGKVEFEINDDCNGQIRIIDSFIAEGMKNNGLPRCGYMSGFISGYLTDTLGETIHVKEVNCKSKGDEYCVHIISPVPKAPNLEHILKEEFL